MLPIDLAWVTAISSLLTLIAVLSFFARAEAIRLMGRSELKVPKRIYFRGMVSVLMHMSTWIVFLPAVLCQVGKRLIGR